jgi:hypothetical protein
MTMLALPLGQVYQANFTLKWLFVPLVVFVLLLLPLVLFRPQRLGYAAGLSLLTFTLLAADWPLTKSCDQHVVCFLPSEVKNDANFRWIMQWWIIDVSDGYVMVGHNAGPEPDNPRSGVQWPHVQIAMQPYPHYPVLGLSEVLRPGGKFTEFRRWGFRVAWGTQPPLRPQGYSATEVETVTVPIWFLMLLCVPLPLLWFRRFRRRRHRFRHGLCLSCGYDLRKSPEKCPECGAGKPSQVPASRPTAVTKSECP